MKMKKMIPNKKYKNVVVEGCEFAWVRLVQKPYQEITSEEKGKLGRNENEY